MNEKRLHIALDANAIYAKSKLYIRKALLRKEGGDLDEYQLWASLAIELLGKSALARIHPSLIADPQHFQSLFAAASLNISSDIKTIAAHTLFERLRHAHPTFDEKMKSFCSAIALRRNAELHSGDTPFRSMRLEAWEAQYWHATSSILEMMSSSLDDWLGISLAETPKAILSLATEAKKQSVLVRIERAREVFEGRKKAEREHAIEEAEERSWFHYRDLFTLVADGRWSKKCPACGGKAYLAGMQVNEDVIDTYGDEDGAWESVEVTYSAEQFHCPVCNLFLDGADEIEAADLDLEFVDISEREMEYEPDYGND